MIWFKNLKISKKLITGFLIVAIIAAVVGVVGIINLLSIRQADTELYENNALALQYSGDTAVNFQQLRYNIFKLSTVDTDKDIQDMRQLINEFELATKKSMDNLMTVKFDNPVIAALNKEIQAQLEQYLSYNSDCSEMVDTGRKAQADDLIVNTMAPLGMNLRDNFLKLSQLVADEAKEAAENNAATALTAIIIMIVVAAAAIVISLILGLGISRSIARPILKLEGAAHLLSKGDIEIEKVMTSQDMMISRQKDEIGSLARAFQELIETTKQQVDAIQKLADGDLTVEIDVKSDKDLLGHGLVTLVESLNHLIKTIATSSEQVASGSALVSHSSMALSQGATEQASSVEELNASL